MRRHIPHQVTERAAACLTCACEDRRNHDARQLMQHARALSATGVLAAIVIADREEHVEIVELARVAITAQREICREHGAFVPERCGEHGRAALQRK